MSVRFLAWDSGGKIVNEGDTFDPVPRLLAESDYNHWLDIENQTKEEIDRLGKIFNFHPLALEDCLHLNQRPKLEEYDGYIFVVLHLLHLLEDESIDSEELHLFLSPRFLVSVHEKPTRAVSEVLKKCKGETHILEKGCDFLFYMLSDILVDEYFPLLDKIDDEIDELEDKILVSPDKKLLTRIFTMKQNLTTLRKIVSPLRELFGSIYRRDTHIIKERTQIYLRDVQDHLVRIHEMIDTYRDMSGNVLEIYLSTVSNYLNEVMKRLTIIATIFLPLGFLTGFFGMNFEKIPFGSGLLLALALVLCFLVPGGMLLLFYRRKWF